MRREEWQGEEETKEKEDRTTTSFFNIAFYNMTDGRLYCTKNGKKDASQPCWPEQLTPRRVVMWKKERTPSIVIYSSRVILSHGEKASSDVSEPTTSPLVDTPLRVPELEQERNEEYGLTMAEVDEKEQEEEQEEEQDDDDDDLFYSEKKSKREAQKKLEWLIKSRGEDIARNGIELGGANSLLMKMKYVRPTTVVGGEGGEDDDEVLAASPETVNEMNDEMGATTRNANAERMQRRARNKAQENNKKIIDTFIKSLIKAKNHTCQSPLLDIDMVGIVKNRKALCCDCGSMTEVKDFNVTSYGITCGCHRTQAHAMDNESVKRDKLALRHVQAKKESLFLERLNRSRTGAPLQERLQKEIRAKYFKHTTLKYELHPLDRIDMLDEVIQSHGQSSGMTRHFKGEYSLETLRCAACHLYLSKFRITVIGHQRRMIKITLCKDCHGECKSLIARHYLPHLNDVMRLVV